MKYDRVYNFSSGPSALPVEVLEECRRDTLNYKGLGMSVMEMSHRSDMFGEIFDGARSLLRRAMNIPDSYEVLFMQGGAYMQFAAVPMNLTVNGAADYIVTGHFSGKAAGEGEKYTRVQIAATSEDTRFDRIPEQSRLRLDKGADYVHICFNNTVYGTKFPYIPDTGSVPLVADLSSCILSEEIDVTKFGVIYAGAQKNIAPAGLVVVIIRKDLLRKPLPYTPALLGYKQLADADSRFNTPPCWSIYIMKLVLEHLLASGGISAMQRRNREKAAIIYDCLAQSKLFRPLAHPGSRSLMNITFSTGDGELDAQFAAQAARQGMTNLKGHPAYGGLRASVYNSMPQEGVRALAAFMSEFEAERAAKQDREHIY